jgi:hypothetical protein
MGKKTDRKNPALLNCDNETLNKLIGMMQYNINRAKQNGNDIITLPINTLQEWIKDIERVL